MNEKLKDLAAGIMTVQSMWASDTITIDQRDKLVDWLIEKLIGGEI